MKIRFPIVNNSPESRFEVNLNVSVMLLSFENSNDL